LSKSAAGNQAFRLFGRDAFRILRESKFLAFEKASENQKNQNRTNTTLLGAGTPFSQALIPF